MDTLNNIIIVTDTASINGGVAKVALSSAIELAQRGYGVTVFSANGPVDPQLEVVDGLTVICLDQYDILNDPKRLRAAFQGIWNARAATEFRKLLATKSTHDTIVHFHSWTKALSSSVFYVAETLGFPTTLTLHDYFTICPTGGLYDHQADRICPLTPLSLECISTHCDPRSRAQKLWRVARQVVQRQVSKIPTSIKHFITISSFSEKIIRRHISHADAMFHQINNPIKAVQPKLPAPGKNKAFLYLGRLSKEKGVKLFAQATALANVEAHVVGSGDCQSIMTNANANIHFHGWLDETQTEAVFAKTRALIFPSLWYETLGLVVLESLAHGIPVIVPDNCAASDLVEDGLTGLVFKSGSVEDLTAKIQLLANNDDYVNRLGTEAAKRYWTDPPTISTHVDALLNVYSTIMSQVANPASKTSS